MPGQFRTLAIFFLLLKSGTLFSPGAAAGWQWQRPCAQRHPGGSRQGDSPLYSASTIYIWDILYLLCTQSCTAIYPVLNTHSSLCLGEQSFYHLEAQKLRMEIHFKLEQNAIERSASWSWSWFSSINTSAEPARFNRGISASSAIAHQRISSNSAPAASAHLARGVW